MNVPHPIIKRFFLPCLLALMTIRACFGAEGQAGKVTVRAILGKAQFSRVSGQFTPLGPGMTLRSGDLIQTASDSALDLDFGEGIGTVRLTEDALLVLEKFSIADSKPAANFELQLHLRKGELLGLARHVPSESRFEVKVANGIAQVIEGQFRVDDRSYVVVVKGKILFAHVPPGGEPAAHTLTAPPAVYFSPAEGVRPAPKALEREVVKQMRSKLPRR